MIFITTSTNSLKGNKHENTSKTVKEFEILTKNSYVKTPQNGQVTTSHATKMILQSRSNYMLATSAVRRETAETGPIPTDRSTVRNTTL